MKKKSSLLIIQARALVWHLFEKGLIPGRSQSGTPYGFKKSYDPQFYLSPDKMISFHIINFKIEHCKGISEEPT